MFCRTVDDVTNSSLYRVLYLKWNLEFEFVRYSNSKLEKFVTRRKIEMVIREITDRLKM